MVIEYSVIDAFTSKPFTGNPAAVCLLPEQREANWLQAVAREMNLPETAFLCREGAGFHLRWFTPTTEVELCGHATLASAHFLWERGLASSNLPLQFQTLSGVLSAHKRGDWTELDFPSTPPEPAAIPEGIAAGLGIAISRILQSRFDYLVVLENELELRNLHLDFVQLAKAGRRGIIVTAPSEDPKFDFVSRFFAPAAGINEDPVTGSAHCCLGPYWQGRLSKSTFLAYQASARGGVIRVRVDGDRVVLGGQAVTVSRGELLAA